MAKRIKHRKMKTKTLIIIVLSLISNKIISQTNERVNPAGKWFFGVELGLNRITSTILDDKNSIQGGILAEYYLARHWTLSGRIKYFKTGLSQNHNPPKRLFKGAVISVPIDFKWEYKIFNNLNGNLKLGFALNKEIKNEYHYPPGEFTDYSTFYINFNPGLGLNYFISKNTAIYLDYEFFSLGDDRNTGGLVQIFPSTPNNNLISIGIKHNY